MNLTRALGIVDAAVLRVLAITTALLIVFRAMPAHADNVGVLIKQLESDSDKVRLAAVLNLTKLGDAKAILPLVKVVSNDSDDAVREAAAVALGKLVDPKSKGSIKNLVINALKKAEANDSSGRVKQQAGRSLAALGASGGGTTTQPSTGGKNGIYVNIGPMSSKTGDASVDSKMRPAMVKVSQQTLTRVASSMATTWSGGSAPTSAQLNQKGFQGFYVDGTLNELKVSGDTVSCKISMLLASYPDKSVFGFLNGGAKVQGGSSPKDIALASDDCVAAVVEDLIAKKIVPTIKTKAGIP
ncbi:MAG: HEAT repeat domain-containing protein [Deltaproteobacteria bacterium]|nr:HEAT repeat domain-containing protein [Deltaproteobacteria bacterium]